MKGSSTFFLFLCSSGSSFFRPGRLGPSCLILCVFLYGFQKPVFAQQQAQDSSVSSQLPNTPSSQMSDGSSFGSISGTVVDRDGALIAGARVTLTLDGRSGSDLVTASGSDGRFSFSHVVPGPFHLTAFIAGFMSEKASGTLHPGEEYEVPDISLSQATATIDVQVTATRQEIAQAQIQAEEKQRVLGVIPNFYVSYVPDAAPLTAKQKFELAWKTNFDPVNFAVTGVVAGIQQSQNDFSGYGQGASGYGKRYAAAFGDFLFANMIGNALLPSVLKQDPRYFYKGTGTIRSRALYAIANAVICKGDNGHWQANYSAILGSAAAGGLSNLYYPAANRNGAALTIENTLIGTAGSAAGNLFQEFLVRKLTPHVPGSSKASKPLN